jgi:hypothetical protein
MPKKHDEQQFKARAVRLCRCRPRHVRRFQGASATAGGSDGLDSSSSRAWAGVFQPRVLRGRLLSLAAT